MQIKFNASRLRLARAAVLVFALVAAGAGMCLLYKVDPAESAWFPPCPFRALTGLYCPGCGSGRALHHLLHAEIAAAFRLNPLMVLLLPVLAVWTVLKALPSLFSQVYTRFAFLGRWAWAVPAALLLYWVARNIPCHPFNMLAPTAL